MFFELMLHNLEIDRSNILRAIGGMKALLELAIYFGVESLIWKYEVELDNLYCSLEFVEDEIVEVESAWLWSLYD